MNLVPPFSDRARAVVGLALQLGCAHIAMITSLDNKETPITRQISIQAQHNSLSFKLHSFTRIQESFSFAQIAQDIFLKNKNGFTMFVLHCKASDAKIFIQATERLLRFQWEQFLWLFLGDSFTEISTADDLPSGVLGIRPNFLEVDLLHDALEMVNRTIQQVSVNDSIGSVTFDENCILHDPPQRDRRGIIRYEMSCL